MKLTPVEAVAAKVLMEISNSNVDIANDPQEASVKSVADLISEKMQGELEKAYEQ